MAKFTQYRAYYLNYDIIANIKLNPNSRQGDVVNKEAMLLRELLEKLNATNNNFTYDDSFGILNIKTNTDLYSFLFPPHIEIINRILAGLKKDSDYGIFDVMWLYFESDCVRDDPHEFHYFFLCQGDTIVDDSFALSDSIGDLPKDILVEHTDYFTSNALVTTAAHVRVLYEKWSNETLPGRIYAMKMKMDKRQELAAESGIIETYDDPSPDFNISILKEIIALRKHFKIIKILLFVIVAIAIYATFFK